MSKFLQILLFAAVSGHVLALSLDITYFDDFGGDSTNCFPVVSAACNLRSAWEACSNVQEHCIITIPAETVLKHNTTLGHLVLTDTASIEITGSGSAIESEVAGSMGSFIRWDIADWNNPASIPSLTIRDTSIVGFQNDGELGGAMAFIGDVSLTIDACKFSDNFAQSGGAMYITNTGSSVQITNTIFEDCSAYEHGGAITFDKFVTAATIAGSQFLNCEATGASGAAGGAIYLNEGNYDLSITSTQFIQCSAVYGGAVYAEIYNFALTFDAATFDRCGAAVHGGGAYLSVVNNRANFVNSAFVDCSAGGYGGGLMVYADTSEFSIASSSFTRCFAPEYGGGVFLAFNNANAQISHTTFTDCECTNYGGGFCAYADNNYLTVESVSFTNCRSMRGGGSVLEHNNNHATFINNVYTNCAATDHNNPRLSGGGGGARFHTYNEDLSLTNNRYVDCTTTGYAGGLYVDTDNNYVMMHGNYFERCTAGKDGGAFWMHQGLGLQIRGSEILDCNAENGGAIFIETRSDDFVIADCTIYRCTAAVHGGCIYIGSFNNNGAVQTSRVIQCHADGNGGGIYVDNSNNNMHLSDTAISSCSATYGGGILFARNDDITIVRTSVSNCVADEAGGGINLFDRCNDIRIVSSEISDNTAGSYGGGLVSEGLNTGLVLAGTAFDRNRAGEDGGGVYIGTGNAQFTVIDTDGYAGMRVVETPHPYASTDAFASTVTVSGASALVLYFDQLTRISVEDSVLIYTDDTRSELLLEVHGDPTWPGIDLPALRIAKDSFFIEMLTANGYDYTVATKLEDNIYGFKLYATPVVLGPAQTCTFTGNVAEGNGGGLFMFSGVPFPMVVNAVFTANKAHDGGGMALRNAITGMTIDLCSFLLNYASGTGGGLVVASASYGLLVQDSAFKRNHASLGGGGLAFTNNNGNDGIFLANNENRISRCEFSGNSASTDGGAILAALSNEFLVTDCQLVNNSAHVDGGAVTLLTTNTVRMERSVLRNNLALGSGGGIGSRAGNDIVLVTVNVTGNTADRAGGGIGMNASTFLTILDSCSIDRNTAGKIGGGIANFASPQALVASGRLTIANNTAQRGSALYFNALVKSNVRMMSRTTIAGNNATVGGTVYWVFDSSMMMEPADVTDPSVVWGYNEAPYGNVTATQAVLLVAPASFEVQSYGSFISPAPVLTLRDYYGQLMPLDGPTAIQTSIAGASADQCDGRFPYLSGTDVLAAGVEMMNCQATLSSLDVSCAPLGKVTLSFAAQLNDLSELDVAEYVITNTTAISFRACRMGEVIVNGQCVVCPRGTFSLEETVTTGTVCQDCIGIDGVTSCYGSTIVVRRNYWRRYPTSLAVLSCMDDLSGCKGGTATGSASCESGYEGALCSVCSEGFYRSDKQCMLCHDQSPTLSPVVIFYICIASIAVVVLAVAAYRRLTTPQVASGSPDLLGNIAAWLREVKKSTNVQLKILISTCQITSNIPTSMKVEFPPAFGKYLNAMSAANLNIVSIVPINCGHSKYNFIDKMIMITLAPIFASIGLLLLCALEYAVSINRVRPAHVTDEEVESQKSKIMTKYLTYFFFLTYLVLPFVSTTIFKTFLCTDIDPLNEDASKSDLFLTADMRVSCSTDYYRRGVAYASIMIIVYVVGIPAMYLALLWRCRKAIMGRFDPPDAAAEMDVGPADANSSKKVSSSAKAGGSFKQKPSISSTENTVGNLASRNDPESHTALMIAFLFEAYEPEFWYWEVVETTRRLMLTTVLSVCGTGTAAQAIFAVLLALMYIKLYGFYSPYTALPDDIVAETGQFQIFLSFLGALIYQRHLLGDEWNSYVGVLLILVNTWVLALFLYFGCRTLAKAMKESKVTESEAFQRGLTMLRLPTLSQLTLPSLEQMRLPSWQELRMPTWEGVTLPSLPQLRVPTWEQATLPSWPQVSLPTVEQWSQLASLPRRLFIAQSSSKVYVDFETESGAAGRTVPLPEENLAYIAMRQEPKKEGGVDLQRENSDDDVVIYSNGAVSSLVSPFEMETV